MKVAEGGRDRGGNGSVKGAGARIVLMHVVGACVGLVLVFLSVLARLRSRRRAMVSSACFLPKKSAILGWEAEEDASASGRRRLRLGGQLVALLRDHCRR